MLPPDYSAISSTPSQPSSGLERVLRIVSLFTMVMTVPQVLTIWVGHNASGVSILSWGTYLFSALLWLVYGIRKRDKTISLACIGWILLDAAVVLGVMIKH